MICNEKMYALGAKRSVIRELFEYGKMRKAAVGEENVFDFSLGNPSVPAPAEVKDTLIDLLSTESPVAIHGYTSAQGDKGTRDVIAKHYEEEFGFALDSDLMYMTCGAAASLTITLNAIVKDPTDEVIAFAPFFPEYRVFAEKAGAKLVVCPPADGLELNVEAFRALLNKNTRAVIINSPNNPSGTVYSEQTISKLAELLKAKERELNKDIFLISDEPYRDVIYDGVVVPYPMCYYDNTIVCYSYSKALSLAGERIGYIALSPTMKAEREVYAAVCGAGRALGYVCASSLFQRVISRCLNDTADIDVYKTNRDLLYNHLVSLGFECVYPKGAFYLFMRAPDGDSIAFSEKAKKLGLLIVPADTFDAPGYLRISYCVSTDMLRRALPVFSQLKESL